MTLTINNANNPHLLLALLELESTKTRLLMEPSADSAHCIYLKQDIKLVYNVILFSFQVSLPIFLIVGLTGNVLAFFVMCSRSYKHKSYSYYLRVLAVTDSLTLILTTITMTNEISHGLWRSGFLQGHNDITCKLTEFLRHGVYVTSSWMVVCFTLDR